MDEVTVGVIRGQLSVLNHIISANNLFDFETGFSDCIDAMKHHSNENIIAYTHSKEALVDWLLSISKQQDSETKKQIKNVAVYIKALLYVQHAISKKSWRGYYLILHHTPGYVKRLWSPKMKESVRMYAQHHECINHSMLIGHCSDDIRIF